MIFPLTGWVSLTLPQIPVCRKLTRILRHLILWECPHLIGSLSHDNPTQDSGRAGTTSPSPQSDPGSPELLKVENISPRSIQTFPISNSLRRNPHDCRSRTFDCSIPYIRLSSYLLVWESITSDTWVLTIIAQGYAINFASPHLSTTMS